MNLVYMIDLALTAAKGFRPPNPKFPSSAITLWPRDEHTISFTRRIHDANFTPTASPQDPGGVSPFLLVTSAHIHG